MNISIFGLGYVGCVSTGCLAQNGHRVIGVDVIDFKVDLVNNGRPTIIEKDIDKILYEQWKNGRISATKDYVQAVMYTEVSMICVKTPSTNNGHLDLSYVYNTSKQIGEGLRKKDGYHVIVIRSTVLPGTNQKVGEIVEKISGKRRNTNFAIVSNPEFLREGSAVEDYNNPAITLLASDNLEAIQIMKDVYKDINAPIEETEIEVAEIIKFVNNSFHALKISFANEVGNICKKMNIDSHKVMSLFCKDTSLNISPYYFKSGFAYGGSCLPKDLKSLVTLSHDLYLNSAILEAIVMSNENQKKIALDMIVSKGKKKIGILGLSFKKGTDDLRFSPTVEITENLLGKGYSILIYDSKVSLSRLTGTNRKYVDKHIPHLSKLISDDLGFVISNSDLLVISHNEDKFRHLEDNYPDKIFIDLVRTSNKQSNDNYEGICW
ncbi:MAG: UDP-glucose 6-dehydrogenase [Candidatus Scalindua rubra]|uniref:UDP-glucose 6-dehydrogenase n=1 Tax=Candidatus Scalindua rubra TaxID=1872076 RepID=A0A1E3XG19_9BACT|nr:MAG: UDP-glucose 6-dehydrogenase [Candidatus Scalindua rubra]